MSTIGLARAAEVRLSFRGLVESERIKLLSRVSTFWGAGIIAAMMISMAATMGFEADQAHALTPAAVAGMATGGVVGAQFAAIVLGAFAITGEYRTGQIRSTFNADPRRTQVLAAKAVVIAAAGFLATLASSILALIVAHVLLALRGVDAGLLTVESVRMLFGAAAYIAAVAVMSLACGAALRRSAPAITAVLGILWALPGTAVMLPEGVVGTIVSFLPSSAGSALYTSTSSAGPSIFSEMTPASAVTLAPWSGLLILLAYLTVIWAVGSAVTRRRDA